MKNFLLFAFVLAFTASTYAQSLTVGKAIKFDNPMSHSMTKVNDTIWTYLDRGTGFYLYSMNGGGYIFGNNGTYTESAMNYDGVANSSVTEVLLWVGAKDIVGTANNLTVNVYSATNDTTPNALLGSGTIAMDQVDTSAASNGFNFIPLTAAAATGGNDFFVGINLADDDTIGVVCNDPSAGDGNAEKRAVLNYPGFGWISHDYLFTGGFDADGMYIPVLDIATGADFMEQNGLQVMRTYPNPTSDVTNINYTIDQSQVVKIKVFDITGKTVFETEEYRTAGEHSAVVNFSDYQSGKYYYTITTEKARITSTIAVVK